MDFYRFCFYLGFTGIASMALLGMSHSVHGLTHGAGGGGGHGHASGHGHAPGHGHGHGDGHGAHGHGEGNSRESMGQRVGGSALAMLSPRFIFSTALGLGATGILIKHFVPLEPWRLLASVCGGLAFEHLLVGPAWNFAFRFASQPAHTLESAVAEEARAVTNFDANGEGLISIDIDGQVVQVLGRLSPAARQSPVRVLSGDVLFVESVDGQRNSCMVSPTNMHLGQSAN